MVGQTASLKRVWQKVKNAQFIRSAAILAGGNVVAQGLTVMASPLLTRLYGPDDFGRLGLYTSLLGLVTVAASLRYETVIVSADDDAEAAYLSLASFAIAVPMSLICSIMMYGLIHFSVLGFGYLPRYSAVLAIPSLFLTAVYVTLRYMAMRTNKFRTISQTLVVQSAARLVTQTGMGALSLGWFGLLCGDLIGRALGIRQMIGVCYHQIERHVRPFQMSRMLSIMRKYKKFPLYSLPSALIDTVSLMLPVPLIAHYYGAESAGYLSLVQSVLVLPMNLISGSVADVFHTRMAEHTRQDMREGHRLFWRTSGLLLLVGAIPTLVLMLLGPTLFRLAFGQQWVTAGVLAAATAPWTLGRLVVSPLSRVVLVLQAHEVKFLYDVVTLVAVIGTISLGFHTGHSLVDTLILLTIVRLLSYVLYFILLASAVSRASKTGSPHP